MSNKNAYDYAYEDEFFEKEMSLLDSKLLSLIFPENFRHKEAPTDEIYHSYWNDVRFKYFPDNIDKRCFIHDNLSISTI